MTALQQAIEATKHLSAAEIEQRILTLRDEEQALLVLYKATRAREKREEKCRKRS